jgi:hypothetical protein
MRNLRQAPNVSDRKSNDHRWFGINGAGIGVRLPRARLRPRRSGAGGSPLSRCAAARSSPCDARTRRRRDRATDVPMIGQSGDPIWPCLAARPDAFASDCAGDRERKCKVSEGRRRTGEAALRERD